MEYQGDLISGLMSDVEAAETLARNFQKSFAGQNLILRALEESLLAEPDLERDRR